MQKYYTNKLLSNIGCKLFLKKISGVDNLPDKGGYIIAANHVSYLDIWVMYFTFLNKAKKYMHFIAKKSLLKDVYFRLMIFFLENKDNKVIILDYENAKVAFDEAKRILEDRGVVSIYPEGTRSLTGKIQKGKTGVVRLALDTHVPVLPMGIIGTFELMPRGKLLPKIKKNVTLNIGKPIYFDKYYKRKVTKRLLRFLTDKVMKEIAELSNQKYNY